MLAVRFPDDIDRRLAELARKTGRTKTDYACEAILMRLEELEDVHPAEERLATPARRWTHADIEGGVELQAGRSGGAPSRFDQGELTQGSAHHTPRPSSPQA